LRLVASFLPYHFQAAVGVPIISIYSSYFFGLVGLSNPFNATVATGYVRGVANGARTRTVLTP
jgi:SP family general alpha glucoside:H+ symporter-like MFS transporter